MNLFNFGQMDMVNPEEKVEYVAYLSHLEKTLSQYLGRDVDVNGRSQQNTGKGLPRVAQTQGRSGDSAPEKAYKKLRLTISSVNTQVLEAQQRILPLHLRRPEWNNSQNPRSRHKELDLSATKNFGNGYGGDGRKKIQHRGEMLCITTTASQVPFDYEYAKASEDVKKQREQLQEWSAERDRSPGSSMERRPYGQDGFLEADFATNSFNSANIRPQGSQQKQQAALIPKDRQPAGPNAAAAWRISEQSAHGGDRAAQDGKQAQLRPPRGVQMHFNEPPGQLGGIKFKKGSNSPAKRKHGQEPEGQRKPGIGHLDHRLKRQIEQRAAEMQKIVREQEYFNSITQDQIDKKLRFLERAVGGRSGTHSHRGSRESSRESLAESAGPRDSLASRRLKGPMYGEKGEEASAQYISDQQSLGSDQVGEEGEEDQDESMKESKSPSPRYVQRNQDNKMKLSTSECQLQIRNLRDDYQNLTRKVIQLREDGSQYFHQEFTENVKTYASNRKSKADLALAVPQTLKPPEEEETVSKEDGEHGEEQEETGQYQIDQVICNSASAFSFQAQVHVEQPPQKPENQTEQKPTETSAAPENEEVNDKKYKIQRDMESINKLASDSGSSDERRSPKRQDSKVRLAKNDGMGTLSQKLLEAGDPIEQRRQEVAIERIEPSMKGYQKGTQKSENKRIENDKKLKELLKTMNEQQNRDNTLGQNSVSNRQSQPHVPLDQPSEKEDANSPGKNYGADEQNNDYISASHSLRPTGVAHRQSETLFESKKNSITAQSGYNTVFVAGEKSLAPPGIQSIHGINMPANAGKVKAIEQAPSIHQLSQPQKDVSVKRFGGAANLQGLPQTQRESRGKKMKITEPQQRDLDVSFRIIPNDPSIRHLPDVSSYDNFNDQVQVPKKKRKKVSDKMRQIYFQTTNQSPTRSQAQYVVQSPQKMSSHLQYLPRESAPFLNKTSLLKGFNERKGNLTKEERTNTLRKLAIARMQRNESTGREPEKMGGGHYISVSKRISPTFNQTSVKFMHNNIRRDSLDSESSKVQRKRNQSLLVQSELEILAHGSLNNMPVVIQQKGIMNNHERIRDHRQQLNSILRKTGQIIINQTTHPAAAATDPRLNDSSKYLESDIMKTTIDHQQQIYQQQYRISKNKIKQLSNNIESQASQTGFSSMETSQQPFTEYNNTQPDVKSNRTKIQNKQKQLENIYTSRNSQRFQQQESGSVLSNKAHSKLNSQRTDIDKTYASSKLKSGRSNPSMTRTFYDSKKNMKSNQLLDKMNIEQSALFGKNEYYKPPIMGNAANQDNELTQHQVQPRNLSKSSKEIAGRKRQTQEPVEIVPGQVNIQEFHGMDSMNATFQRTAEFNDIGPTYQRTGGFGSPNHANITGSAKTNIESLPALDSNLPSAQRQRPQFPQQTYMDDVRNRQEMPTSHDRIEFQAQRRIAVGAKESNDQLQIQQRVARMLSESSKVFEQHLRQGELARQAHQLTNERAKQYIAFKQNESAQQRALKRI